MSGGGRTPWALRPVLAVAVCAVVTACSSPRAAKSPVQAATPASQLPADCKLFGSGEIQTVTKLAVRSLGGDAYATNASSCRWYLDPAPNTVFMTVVAPQAGVSVTDLFTARTKSAPGTAVASLGDQGWEGSAADDSVVMTKGNRLFTVTVQGPGSPAVPYDRTVHQRLGIALLQLVSDRV